MKKKNHVIISVDKNVTPKPNSKVGLEGKFLHMIKGIHEKPTANIIFNSERRNQEEIHFVCSNHS